ncbi:MAG: VOC family protein [Acidimicrobiales bacterium]
MSVALTELMVGDDPEPWRAAGFAIDGDVAVIGSVRVRLAGTAAGRGILGWSMSGLAGDTTIDGLATTADDGPPPTDPTPAHPNGVVAFDHLVLLTPDLARTTAALAAVGVEPRRHRDVGTDDDPRRQVFFWIGEPILEMVGPRVPSGDGPSRFFGLALTVDDIDATAAELGDRVGRVKDAVQPGRRITTLRHRDLDLSVPIAFMSAHVRSDA